MNTTRSIKLVNDGGVFRQYLIVFVRDTNEAWDIREIEIYSSPDYALASLIADDICFNDLPASTQMAIIGALNADQHQKDEAKHQRGLRRLWADIQADAALSADVTAARAWH